MDENLGWLGSRQVPVDIHARMYAAQDSMSPCLRKIFLQVILRGLGRMRKILCGKFPTRTGAHCTV